MVFIYNLRLFRAFFMVQCNEYNNNGLGTITIDYLQHLDKRGARAPELAPQKIWSYLDNQSFIRNSPTPHPIKIDLDKKLGPKQKTIQAFNIDA